MAQIRPAWLVGKAWFAVARLVARASAKWVPRGCVAVVPYSRDQMGGPSDSVA